MEFKTLEDLDLRGKIVLLRTDLNVPAKDGFVSDASRIDRLKPTIEHLKNAGARTLILSHFGRPEGTKKPEYSLEFLLPALKDHWGVDVSFAKDCIGEPAETLAKSLKEGEFGLLENTRFYEGEEKNDQKFAGQLAKLGDIFVNDAFSAAHRAHASTEGLAHHLPAVAGKLMEAELSALTEALESPVRPVMAIVGGAKISTKLDLLENLVKKTDILVLGGGMANTFLYAKGTAVGNSLCEKDMVDQTKTIINKANQSGCKIVAPLDARCASELTENARHEIFDIDEIPENQMILDIGPKSEEEIKALLHDTKTVVWNGPLGAFEIPPFDIGTVQIARAIANHTSLGTCLSVAGGGDTLAAIEKAGVSGELSYISTAGGAFLEWLEGKPLPGITALTSSARAA